MVKLYFSADFGELLHLPLQNDLQRELHCLDGQEYIAEEFIVTGFGLFGRVSSGMGGETSGAWIWRQTLAKGAAVRQH